MGSKQLRPPITCVRATKAPKDSGFTIGHVRGIIGHVRHQPPAKDHLSRHARARRARHSGLLRGLHLQPFDRAQCGPLAGRSPALRSRAAVHLQGLRQARRRREAGFQLEQDAGSLDGLSMRFVERRPFADPHVVGKNPVPNSSGAGLLQKCARRIGPPAPLAQPLELRPAAVAIFGKMRWRAIP